ncbi:MAG TPA: hypothetical protein VJR06_01190 [Nitrososphaerales archaeon]|nr:hypothetical protein [Nitrososphaerales archaeon]
MSTIAQSQPRTPKDIWADQRRTEGATVLDDVLQKADDPIAEIKKAGDRVAIIVPDEYNWDPKLAPFKNPLNKRFYDADELASQLQQAGLELYILRQIDFSGWSFLTAEATRKLNSEERRRLKRAAEKAGQSSSGATSTETSSPETPSESKPATQQDTGSGDSHNETATGVVGGT